jgi:hypothetical protein
MMVVRETKILAVDILLEPDAQMLERADRDNERLRKIFPDSFALDDQHRPHITLLQCFVAARDMDALYAACGKVIASADVTRMVLQAVRFGYTPGPGMGVAGIWAAMTPALAALQSAVIAAAAPFQMPTGGIEAFTAGHGNPAYDAALIDYVTTFVARNAGAGFDPHVSTGVAATADLDRIAAEPFDAFAFSLSGAAVYQLGPFGTAARLLKRWESAV